MLCPMNKIGFDNEKYLKLQSQNIRDRISKFGGKLYLEFGGKLFDDYHASRVVPGFKPDSKVNMLLEMKDDAEIVIAISADDIERIICRHPQASRKTVFRDLAEYHDELIFPEQGLFFIEQLRENRHIDHGGSIIQRHNHHFTALRHLCADSCDHAGYPFRFPGTVEFGYTIWTKIACFLRVGIEQMS